MDRTEVTVLVLLDFSKAFDRIPHDILIRKLRNFKIHDSTIQWFISYLAGRCQAVVDEGGKISDWIDTFAGVPQGSVLVPLLFSIFINDLPSLLRFSKYMLYADDAQIYRSCDKGDLRDTIDKISRDVTAIYNWALANGLSLNLAKSKAMILGTTSNLSFIDFDALPRVCVGDVQLEYVSEAKNLGIWIMQNLSWKKHVSFICQKVYRTLRQLRPHKHALSFEIRKTLVQSLILPHFDYACLVFHTLTNELNDKLQVAQNACTRFVFGNIARMEHITAYRKELKWLTVRARREYFLGTTLYKLLTTGRPNYLATDFIEAADSGLRRSERLCAEPLLIRNFNLTSLKKSFAHSGSYFFNNLPRKFHSMHHSHIPLSTFKRELLEHLHSEDR